MRLQPPKRAAERALFCDIGECFHVPNYVDPALCERWADRIHSQRSIWIERFGGAMFSYGRSWYLDIEQGDLNVYHHQAAASNALLSRLRGLTDALRRAGAHLVGPDGQVGLPLRARHENLGPHWCETGVHILPPGLEGELHADFEGLAPYPDKLFDPNTRAYSAVLCVQGQGPGLHVYDRRRFTGAEYGDALEAEILSWDPVAIDYQPGSLTVLDAFLYHRIPRWEDERLRMTAVMHFLYLERPYPHWEYWF